MTERKWAAIWQPLLTQPAELGQSGRCGPAQYLYQSNVKHVLTHVLCMFATSNSSVKQADAHILGVVRYMVKHLQND